MLKRLLFWRKNNRTILFYRNFQNYSGGHQKVADYFSHLISCDGYTPAVSFSSTTDWSSQNPWTRDLQAAATPFTPTQYDYLFLAGLDWLQYEQMGIDSTQPVINLIQHVRHGDPESDVYPFLKHRAIRICVSPEVEQAIQATGKVNGPVYTISNGHHTPAGAASDRDVDMLIVGAKNPDMATKLSSAFADESLKLLCLDAFIPREQLLATMARSRIVVLLPHATEGFYLPALEAMKLAELVVVPDCVGNRSFCIDGYNCLRPEYQTESIIQACKEALQKIRHPDQLLPFIAAAEITVADHSLSRERTEFLQIMDDIEAIW